MTAGGDALPRVAVCSFQRVFDTHPCQDAMTLAELTEAFSRFLLKPQLQAKIDREIHLIEEAATAVLAGRQVPGKVYGKLAAATRDARGADLATLVRDKADAMIHDAQRSAKRDFRLWAPALFRPGGKRDDGDVAHISCLVLDYDDGTPVDEASEVWRPWFHLIHTTWSHTDAHHKFRVILPLASPVAPADWRAVWTWADKRTGRAVDPTGKSLSRAWAIPVVAAADAPRRTHANPGPLLDPVAEGLVDTPSPTPLPPREQLTPCLLRRDPDAAYVEGSRDAGPAPSFFDDDAVWSGGATDPDPSSDPAALAEVAATTRAALGASGPTAPPVDAATGPHARLQALEARVADLEARLAQHAGGTLVDALERLVMLHEQGAIDDAELAAAKRALLG